MEIGDAVHLKGSSFFMVVSDKTESGSIECVWHDNNGVANRAYYPEKCLEHFEKKKQMGIAKGD